MSLTIKIKRLNGNEPTESEVVVPLGSIGAATGNAKVNRAAIAIFIKDTFKLDATPFEVMERPSESNEVVARSAHMTTTTGAPASQIRLKIMTNGGVITTLAVSRRNTIAHVKDMYHRAPGVNVPRLAIGTFELVFNGQIVPGWKILQDLMEPKHPIEDGDTLLVRMK